MEMRIAWTRHLLQNTLKGGLDRKRALRYGLYAGLPIALILAGFGLYGQYAHLKRAVAAGERNIAIMEAMKMEYIQKKAAFDAVASRMGSSTESPVAVVEELAKRTGTKERITSIKPLEEKTAAGYTDRPVEVKVESIDMNQLVNFFYLAANGERLVVIRDLTIKERFENRELVDATFTASLVSRN